MYSAPDRPLVTAMLFAAGLGPRLALGWPMGELVSAGGVGPSCVLDLPTGATIVATWPRAHPPRRGEEEGLSQSRP